MNITPDNQIKLHGLSHFLNDLIRLHNNQKLPNKILLSGQKGIGKCTLAYHLINYILSQGEQFSYNLEKNEINLENSSFKLIQNKANINFNLVDIDADKKSIDITQIRNLILNLKNFSFNDKPRFILIDNIEYLSKNSVNALLKIIEEPTNNAYFILINNNKKVLSTLKSRCLNFKIYLSNNESKFVIDKLLNDNISNLINDELIDYYITPGKIINLIKFAEENLIDLKNKRLMDFLTLLIDKSYYKKESSIKYFVNDFFELFLRNKISSRYQNFRSYFVKQIDNIKRFNLDDETLFIEFKDKMLNG
tara:strand:+ start:3265 stop:4185 length:921 start_codon:yes stop_codon:yes gene_type:complete